MLKTFPAEYGSAVFPSNVMNENDEDLQAYNDFTAYINRIKRSRTNETKAVPYLDGEKRSYLHHIFNCAMKRHGSLSSEEAVIFIWSNMSASTEIPESDYVWFYKKHREILNRYGYCDPFEAQSGSASEQDLLPETPPSNGRT